MLISHSHRFIYIKTKKTAGTSVEVALQRHCLPPGIELPEKTDQVVSDAGVVGARLFDERSRPAWYNHMPAVEIAERVGPEIWSSYVKFCVVRNPWDKLVSWYYFHRSEPARSMSASEILLDFRGWIRENLMTDGHLYRYPDGRLAVDFVIRFENLSADLRTVCDRLNIEAPTSLLRLKGGYRQSREGLLHYRDYYDPATRALVDAAYAREIDELDYRF